MNNVMSLEAVQTALIRDILNVDDVLVLEKLRKMLHREEKETMIVAEDEVPYMTKAEILANFDQACKELKMNLEGKLELKTLEEALDEL